MTIYSKSGIFKVEIDVAKGSFKLKSASLSISSLDSPHDADDIKLLVATVKEILSIRKSQTEYSQALLDVFITVCPGWATDGTPESMSMSINARISELKFAKVKKDVESVSECVMNEYVDNAGVKHVHIYLNMVDTQTYLKGWYFGDETERLNGPFETIEKCESSFKEYCDDLYARY
jgi:hypothetical protein